MSTTTTAPAPANPTTQRFSREWFQNLAIRYAMVIVMLLVIAFFLYRSARFGTVDNVTTILIAAAPFALIALGQTLVILTGGIDLSVGSVIAVSAMSGALFAKSFPDQVWLSVLVAVLVAHSRQHQRCRHLTDQRPTLHRHTGNADPGLRTGLRRR